MLSPYVYDLHFGLLIMKIMSIQAHRNVERESVRVFGVCVLDKLIILFKFVTEQERIRCTYTTSK